MQKYVFRLDGQDRERTTVECETLDQARNEGLRYLGGYLADHPGFASEGNWRLNIESEFGQTYLQVIVATVTPREARQRQADDASGT